MRLKLIVLSFCLLFAAGIAQAQTQTGYRIPTRLDIGGGRMTGDMWCQYGTNGVRFKFGTQTVTQVGTTGVINGTNATGLPSLDITYSSGSTSANFNGFNAVYIAGSQVGTSGALTGKLDATGGVGTNNTFNNPTIAGVGTITASFGANGLVITPAEYASTDNATGELQSQINGKQPTLINNTPGTITNVLGYTPSANTQGSITTALGYTPPANTLGSLTTALGYTPPANTAGSITTALGYTPTDLGNSIELGTETTGNTDNITEGSTNKYHTDARVNAAVGSLTANTLSDVNINMGAENDFVKIVGGQLVAGSSSASVAFSEVTGSASASQLPLISGLLGSATSSQLPLISGLLGSATSSQLPLISGLLGSATSAQLPTVLELPATTTVISGTSSVARLYNLSSVGNSLNGGTQYLLHFNGGSGTSNFVDSSDFARTVVAVGSATHSPTQVKFGSTSAYLDGSDSITTVSSVTDFSPGTQTFYADIWAYYSGTWDNVDHALFGKRSGAGSWANDGHEYYLRVNDAQKLAFEYNIGGTSNTITATNTSSVSNGWHHYKIVNASTGFFMYFDGALVQSAAKITITATTGGTPKFVIGERNSDMYWPGYVDEMNFVVGAEGETSGFTPPTIEYGIIYDKYTSSYIPPGTTTPSIKQEYGTVSNMTVTYIQGDLIVDKPSRFSTITAYCAEFSLSKPVLAQAYSLYPCDSEHKDIVETGSITPQQEAFNTVLNTGIFKFLWKTPELEKAKPMITELTKVDYGRKDYKHEKELWEEVYKGNYTINNEGSATVNTGKMNSDFEAYYLNKQYFEFDNMSEQEKNELVYNKKKDIAYGDPRNKSDNIGIVLDKECPDEYKLNDVPELSKMVQTNLSALKEAAERIVKMEAEIEALKAIVNP